MDLATAILLTVVTASTPLLLAVRQGDLPTARLLLTARLQS